MNLIRTLPAVLRFLPLGVEFVLCIRAAHKTNGALSLMTQAKQSGWVYLRVAAVRNTSRDAFLALALMTGQWRDRNTAYNFKCRQVHPSRRAMT